MLPAETKNPTFDVSTLRLVKKVCNSRTKEFRLPWTAEKLASKKKVNDTTRAVVVVALVVVVGAVVVGDADEAVTVLVVVGAVLGPVRSAVTELVVDVVPVVVVPAVVAAVVLVSCARHPDSRQLLASSRASRVPVDVIRQECAPGEPTTHPSAHPAHLPIAWSRIALAVNQHPAPLARAIFPCQGVFRTEGRNLLDRVEFLFSHHFILFSLMDCAIK